VHWLDRFASYTLAHTPPRRRVFRHGWGDTDILDYYVANARHAPPIPEIPIAEHPAWRDGNTIIQDLTFESPGEFLPEPARLARARLITTTAEPERLVLLAAAWNEGGYAARTKLAHLLSEHGIASVLLEQPFYGSRSPAPDGEQPITRVSDFAIMGRSAVGEGRVLANHFRRLGYTVGVSGFSMGGNTAAFVAATVPFAVAATPIAAAHSAAPPFLHGLIGLTFDWDALGGNNPHTRQRLAEFLLSASVLYFDPPVAPGAAVLLAATRDGYVPTSAVQAIHRHWPGSVMQWVNAGHGSLLWRHKDRFVAAICESFDHLDDSTEDPAGRSPPPAAAN
jgi:hypothetical protein